MNTIQQDQFKQIFLETFADVTEPVTLHSLEIVRRCGLGDVDRVMIGQHLYQFTRQGLLRRAARRSEWIIEPRDESAATEAFNQRMEKLVGLRIMVDGYSVLLNQFFTDEDGNTWAQLGPKRPGRKPSK